MFCSYRSRCFNEKVYQCVLPLCSIYSNRDFVGWDGVTGQIFNCTGHKNDLSQLFVQIGSFCLREKKIENAYDDNRRRTPVAKLTIGVIQIWKNEARGV